MSWLSTWSKSGMPAAAASGHSRPDSTADAESRADGLSTLQAGGQRRMEVQQSGLESSGFLGFPDDETLPGSWLLVRAPQAGESITLPVVSEWSILEQVRDVCVGRDPASQIPVNHPG
ncbi:hypothetical protein GCM10027425_33720 [Alteromonas gracilis]